MAYITLSNFKKITLQLDGQKFISEDDINDELNNDCLCEGLILGKFLFLNKTDKRNLLAFKRILTHPEISLQEQYKRIEFHDTYTYVEEYRPAYHKSSSCSRLLHDFDGIIIPYKIQKDGKDVMDVYRAWWRENKHYLEEEQEDIFYTLLHSRWGVEKYEIDYTKHKNSGNTSIENTLDGCCLAIKQLMDEWLSWLKDDSSPDQQLRAKSFYFSYRGKNAYLGDKSDSLQNNDTGFSDDDIKRCLSEMQHRFKSPILDLIKQYFKIKYNPNLDIKEEILIQLGFGACSECCKIPLEEWLA